MHPIFLSPGLPKGLIPHVSTPSSSPRDSERERNLHKRGNSSRTICCWICDLCDLPTCCHSGKYKATSEVKGLEFLNYNVRRKNQSHQLSLHNFQMRLNCCDSWGCLLHLVSFLPSFLYIFRVKQSEMNNRDCIIVLSMYKCHICTQKTYRRPGVPSKHIISISPKSC